MGTAREEIAKNLLYYRKKFGFTQKELAEKLNVKNTAVSNWEKGVNSIDIDTLVEACKIFNITLNDMYGQASEEKCFTLEEKEIIYAYRIADEKSKNIVKQALDINGSQSLVNDIQNTLNEIKLPIKQK